jgi:hypothetical protein
LSINISYYYRRKDRGREGEWTLVSAAGIVIYAGFDDLPYADTMLNVSLCAVLGSTVSGLFTGQGVAVNYLRAVDNYNLSVMGFPIGKR